MGLDPLFLRLIGMHFDPQEYPAVTLHLDLYATGNGLSDDQMARVLRCGVERYGDRFIPSLGVLNDGEGSAELFVSVETLQRNLTLARKAGVAEVWLFSLNGLNDEYLSVLRETLPLELLPGKKPAETTHEPERPWFVTNGLLVSELITGQVQIGTDSFIPLDAANIPIAGDPSNDFPTYASLERIFQALAGR
jgi:hypothetical protein